MANSVRGTPSSSSNPFRQSGERSEVIFEGKNVRVEVQGDDVADNAKILKEEILAELELSLRKLEGLWLETIKDYLSEGPASPLAPSYRRRKEALVGSGKPDFKLSGQLLESLNTSYLREGDGVQATLKAGRNRRKKLHDIVNGQASANQGPTRSGSDLTNQELAEILDRQRNLSQHMRDAIANSSFIESVVQRAIRRTRKKISRRNR